jgi:hypothetical protein
MLQMETETGRLRITCAKKMNNFTLHRIRKGEWIAKSGTFMSCHGTPSKILQTETRLLANLSALINQYLKNHQPARNTY